MVKEHLLILQKTQVWFPDSHGVSQPPETPVPRDLMQMPSPDLRGLLYVHTLRHAQQWQSIFPKYKKLQTSLFPSVQEQVENSYRASRHSLPLHMMCPWI